MSVPGLLDAMRSSYPPAVRLIWQCLENRANSARFWSMTDEAIAHELRLSVNTVSRSIRVLERDSIIRCVRHKRRPTTFHMLRSYPEGCPRPRHEPEVMQRIEPELTLQDVDSSAELTPQNGGTLSPPVKNPPEESERALSRSPASIQDDFDQILLGKEGKPPVFPEPPCPAPAVSRGPEPGSTAVPGQGGAAGLPVPVRARGRARGTPLPDDWNPTATDREFARSRGLDPPEMILAFAAYYRADGGARVDWSATWQLWCIREPGFRRPERKTTAEIRSDNARSALAGYLRGMAEQQGLGSVQL